MRVLLVLVRAFFQPLPNSAVDAKWRLLDRSPVLDLLGARYGKARTLRVKFLERYRETGRLVRAEGGIASFLRPGKMRWDYQAPEKNKFLVDGK